MEIEILETTIIPPPPSQHNFPTLSLSHLDSDPNLDVTIRTLRFYARAPDNPAATIAGALRKALSHFYPLAGALRRRSSDSRLEVYAADGGGVVFISAYLPLRLADLLRYQPGHPLLDQLAPDPVGGDELSHPLSLQVTCLAGGGFALGMCVHHALCDGAGATQFLATLSALTRREGPTGPHPVWDRALLGPWTPRIVTFRTPFDIERVAARPYEITAPLARECFYIGNPNMYWLRTELDPDGSHGFTTFEVSSAFIWAAKLKASRVAHDTMVRLVYSMSIKKIMKPPLPPGYWGNTCVPVSVQITVSELLAQPGYWGNTCVPVSVQITVSELLAQPLWKTVKLIKESKQSVDEEYVRSYIDFQELHYEKGATVVDRVTAFTDWSHLGHSEVDFTFGLGSPMAVWPLSWKLMGSVEPCFFLPPPDGPEGRKMNGFTVLVSLPREVLESFRSEMEVLREQTPPQDQVLPRTEARKLSHI